MEVDLGAIIAELAGSGALGYLGWSYIKGLKEQLSAVQATAEQHQKTLTAQQKTIEAVQATAEQHKKTLEAQNLTLSAVQKTADQHKATLEAMERRLEEAMKIGDMYKSLIKDFPALIEQYKTAVNAVKDDIIKELELARDRKDAQLSAVLSSRLDEYVKIEEMLKGLPEIHQSVIEQVSSLERRVVAVRQTLVQSSHSQQTPSQLIREEFQRIGARPWEYTSFFRKTTGRSQPSLAMQLIHIERLLNTTHQPIHHRLLEIEKRVGMVWEE